LLEAAAKTPGTSTRIFVVHTLDPSSHPTTAHLTTVENLRANPHTHCYMTSYHTSQDFMPFGSQDLTGALRYHQGGDAAKVLAIELNSDQDNDTTVRLPLPPRAFIASQFADEVATDPGAMFDNDRALLTNISAGADSGILQLLPKRKLLTLGQPYAHTCIFLSPTAAQVYRLGLEKLLRKTPGLGISLMPAHLFHESPPPNAYTLHLNMPIDDGIAFVAKALPGTFMSPVGRNTLRVIPQDSALTPDTILQKLKQLQNLVSLRLQTYPFSGVVLSDTFYPLLPDPPREQAQRKQVGGTANQDGQDGYVYIAGLSPTVNCLLLEKALTHFSGSLPRHLPKTAWLRDARGRCVLRFTFGADNPDPTSEIPSFLYNYARIEAIHCPPPSYKLMDFAPLRAGACPPHPAFERA
jgi:hypothetical protein